MANTRDRRSLSGSPRLQKYTMSSTSTSATARPLWTRQPPAPDLDATVKQIGAHLHQALPASDGFVLLFFRTDAREHHVSFAQRGPKDVVRDVVTEWLRTEFGEAD